MKKDIGIIDIEFTGLDNDFIRDNEIIQVKILNNSTGRSAIKNFNSIKKIGAHTQLETRVERYENCPFFSREEFEKLLAQVGLTMSNQFWGFSPEMDIYMLFKYGIELNINDIRSHYQKTNVAYRMATEGSNLEATYLIVTGDYPPACNHNELSELKIIHSLFRKMKYFEADDFMQIVPFGFCSGMSIYDYVQNYRRSADGYRFNNSNEYARSLRLAIEYTEYMDDDDFDFDDYDDDDY
jgi:hypothetical protein